MQPRIILTGVLVCIAGIATANGAMGLGLEMWDLGYWFAYVVAIIVLEAWLIGKWLKLSWQKSLVISLLANFLTGVMCGGAGLFAPFLHMSFVGSRYNPNPFMNAVVLLSVFAIPSAAFEYVAWRYAIKKGELSKLFLRVILVHLITIPIGLAILLIPENPYKGMEGMTNYNRRMNIWNMAKSVESYIAENGTLPTSTDHKTLARELETYDENLTAEDIEVSLYFADFRRFSTGENFVNPSKIHWELAAREIDVNNTESSEEWVWYIEPLFVGEFTKSGLAVDLNSGAVQMCVELPEALEY